MARTATAAVLLLLVALPMLAAQIERGTRGSRQPTPGQKTITFSPDFCKKHVCVVPPNKEKSLGVLISLIFSWWIPQGQPAQMPVWTVPSTQTADGVSTSTQAIASCTGITTKGIATAGGCTCPGTAPDPDNYATDFVSDSAPIYVSSTGTVLDCRVNNLPCNAWYCECSAYQPDFQQNPVPAGNAISYAYCI